MQKIIAITKKSTEYMVQHKIITLLCVSVIVIGTYGIVKSFSSEEQTTTKFGTVRMGTIKRTVRDTGQVVAVQQKELTTKTSGDLVYLNAVVGQKVAAGAVIAQVDATEAQYELESAQMSFDDFVTIDKADIRAAQYTQTQAENSYVQAYTDAKHTIVSSITTLNTSLDTLDSLYAGDGYLSTNNFYRFSQTAKDYRERAYAAYVNLRKELKSLEAQQRTVSTETAPEVIQALVDSLYTISTHFGQAAKYAQDAVVYVRDKDTSSQKISETYETTTALVTTLTNVITTSASTQNTLVKVAKERIDAQENLEELLNGPDELDIRSQTLSLKQKKDSYNNYFVQAPFAGIIASVSARKGDTVNNGTTVATLVTEEKQIEISLNEIDVAAVSVGQKAVITFDAIDGLEATGVVTEVDLIGSVSQGVVDYTVKVAIESTDERIKSGMTATVEIITAQKDAVLVVPQSAVTTVNGQTFVTKRVEETAEETVRIPVEVGLKNDTEVEIVSGVSEGDSIVTQTVTRSTTESNQRTQGTTFFGATSAPRSTNTGGTFRQGGMMR